MRSAWCRCCPRYYRGSCHRRRSGDGAWTCKRSAAAWLMSGANILYSLGWRPREPWLIEVMIPAIWTGTRPQSTLSARGRMGTRRVRARAARNLPMSNAQRLDHPARGAERPRRFIRYSELNVHLEWNQSFTSCPDRAYLRHGAGGGRCSNPRNPTGLSGDQMRELQAAATAAGWIYGAARRAPRRGPRRRARGQRELACPADCLAGPPALFERACGGMPDLYFSGRNSGYITEPTKVVFLQGLTESWPHEGLLLRGAFPFSGLVPRSGGE